MCLHQGPELRAEHPQLSLVAWKPPAELKRLQPVGALGQYYAELLSELYAGSHKLLPKALQPSVAALDYFF